MKIAFQLFSLAPFCQIFRVTDENLIVETAVWPIPFLINVFAALKGSQLYLIQSNVFKVMPTL